MQCTFKYNSNFKGIVELLSHITETITFHFTENGMNIQAMDPSHISLIYIELFIDQFTNLDVPKPFTISLATTTLKPIVRSIRDTDVVSLKVKEQSAIVDIILDDGDNRNKYSLQQLYVDIESLDITSHDISSNLIITNRIGFSKILSDIKNTDANEIILHVDNTNVSITAQSEMLSLKIKPSSEVMKVHKITACEPTTLKFNTKHILNIPKILAICKPKINIFLDNESPLLVQVSLVSDSDKKSDGIDSSIRYYIAPKIDDS